MLYKSKSWLHQKYIVERLSSIDMAELANVTKATILRALKRHNIPRRQGKAAWTEKRREKITLIMSGENHPQWVDREYRICEWCEEDFQCRQDSEQRFCSHSCCGKWVGAEYGGLYDNDGRYTTESTIGPLNPQWRGGISFEPYDSGFTEEFKEFIRERDNHMCVLCSSEESGDGSGRRHDVHHIDYNKQNTVPSNCVTLCKSCHSRTHHNRSYWSNVLLSLYPAWGAE